MIQTLDCLQWSELKLCFPEERWGFECVSAKKSFSLTFRSCKTPSLLSVFNMWWRIDGSSDCVFQSFSSMRNVFSFSRLIKTESVLYPVLVEVSLCVTSCFQTHACLMGTAENKNVFCYSQTKNCSDSRYHFWYCFTSVIRTL